MKQTLADRIAAIQAEANAWIDAKTEALAKEAPGVPLPVLRGLIANRAPGCPCRQVQIEEAKQ